LIFSGEGRGRKPALLQKRRIQFASLQRLKLDPGQNKNGKDALLPQFFFGFTLSLYFEAFRFGFLNYRKFKRQYQAPFFTSNRREEAQCKNVPWGILSQEEKFGMWSKYSKEVK